MTSHLLVIDGDNLAHRLHHGVKDRPAHESFGFALQRFRKQFRPTHAVVVFDPIDGHSWRREIWPAYKRRDGDRPKPTAMLLECRKETGPNGYARSVDDSVEADDLIGAYVEAAVRDGMDATIVSTDKDLTQLVRWSQRRVCMRDDVRRIDWWPASVLDRFGVQPDQVPDLLALIGDKSDNYPGVPGIGPKTAAALLAQHGDLETLLANKNLVRAKRVMALLREHEATARTCYRLAQLRTDVALPVPLDGCEVRR